MTSINFFLQISIGGSYDSDVYFYCFSVTYFNKLTGFQNSEQIGLQSAGISPISSKKRVPLLASSNNPFLSFMAPVKAPPYVRTIHFPAILY